MSGEERRTCKKVNSRSHEPLRAQVDCHGADYESLSFDEPDTSVPCDTICDQVLFDTPTDSFSTTALAVSDLCASGTHVLPNFDASVSVFTANDTIDQCSESELNQCNYNGYPFCVSERVITPVTCGHLFTDDDVSSDGCSQNGMFDNVSNDYNDHVVYVSDGISMCPDEYRFDKHHVGGHYSQMNAHCWKYYLGYEPDLEFRDYLYHGILHGFPIVDPDVSIGHYRCSNYKAVLSGDAFDYVNSLIMAELAEGKYVRANYPPHCVHALGVVPKQDGSFRPITDCKRPIGDSINNFMNETFQHFTYHTVDQVATNMNEYCYMASVDISSAYRSIPIHPDHWKYQAVSWIIDDIPVDLFDTHLSFGLRCAPYIFTMISNFVVTTMDRLGYHGVINYIDDFLVYGDTFEQCQEAQTVLIHLLGQLGFRVSWKKCSSPAQKVKYLGILFDSVNMELSLPAEKLDRLHTEMLFFKDKTRATKRQLQRLCGLLAHCSKVVRGGRTFSRRVIDLLKGLPDGNPRVYLSQDFRKDLQWWSDFAKVFNGKANIIRHIDEDQRYVFTDSCLKGYGFALDSDWQAGYFSSNDSPAGLDELDPEHLHWVNVDVPSQDNINYLELVPVFQALERFSVPWSDKHVIVFTDNTQVVSMVNRGISENSNCMDMIRHMFWIAATNNIYVTARHIPGVMNVLPDTLSRIFFENSLECLLKFGICCRRLE